MAGTPHDAVPDTTSEASILGRAQPLVWGWMCPTCNWCGTIVAVVVERKR